ncbi:MAG: leucine-rich repeat domain-containing protein [Clostridiales Family XIII bacterium]|jgi:hypothetical protein|nr:leucine-rich repeat domain-containing protein [Clostridiales Family XIII bacterium]
MRRIVASIACLTLMCALFAGCAGEDSQKKTAEDSPEIVESSEYDDLFHWVDTRITGLSPKGEVAADLVVPGKCTELADGVFFKRENLETVVFQSAKTEILRDDYIFYGCPNLTEVVFPEGIAEIPANCFLECPALQSVTCPKSVKSIGEFAFPQCENLAGFDFPEGLETIGRSAFGGCTSLKEVSFPKSLEKIGEKAFWNNEALETVDFAEGSKLTEIGESAFAECDALKTVKLPQKLKILGEKAFERCAALESVYLPESLEEMGTLALHESHPITVYVRKGSYAEVEFDNYNLGNMTKELY